MYSRMLVLICLFLGQQLLKWKISLSTVRSDTYVYAVLSCLPWVGRELYEKKEQDLERLLKHIEIYVRKRSRKHVPGLRVWRSDRPHPQEEYLDCLWAQVWGSGGFFSSVKLLVFILFSCILFHFCVHSPLRGKLTSLNV